jgi:hypothetical protein
MKYCDVHTLLNVVNVIVWIKKTAARLLLLTVKFDLCSFELVRNDSRLVARQKPNPSESASCGMNVDVVILYKASTTVLLRTGRDELDEADAR